MYIIVTYAREQMRGVQVRGIRIAQGLPKDEVTFYNSGDDSWIRKFGYKIENVNLSQFYLGDKVQLPVLTKCLIFPDLPTNHPGQTALLLEAARKQIPVIIVDNIYSVKQLDEWAYRNAQIISDRLILLGLSYIKEKIKNNNIVIVPPLIEKPLDSEEEARKKIFKKFNFAGNKKIVLGVSYNIHVLEVIDKLAEKYKDVEFVLLGSSVRKAINIKEVTIANSEEIVELIRASDLVLCKMGYQQMLETYALGKPLIAVGRERGLRKWWLEGNIKEVVFDFKNYSVQLDDLFNKILFDKDFRSVLLSKIKLLHDRSFDGIETIADNVKKVKFRQKKLSKTVLLAIVEADNAEKIRRTIRSEPFILPIIISYPFATKTGFRNVESSRKISDFESEGSENLIRADFSLITGMSPHSAHGLVRILPWYEEILKGVVKLLREADKVIIVGEKTKQYFQGILRKLDIDKIEFI